MFLCCLQRTLKKATISIAVIDLDHYFPLYLTIYYALKNNSLPQNVMPLAATF
jgi:hypothetical protein